MPTTRQKRPNERAPESGKTCPDCMTNAVVPSDSLEWRENVGGRILVLRRLGGERCTACGSQWFDQPSYDAIARERQDTHVANFEASISKVGGGLLGLYFPKDLKRIMKLEARTRVLITPTSPTSMLVEIVGPIHDDVKAHTKAVDVSMGM